MNLGFLVPLSAILNTVRLECGDTTVQCSQNKWYKYWYIQYFTVYLYVICMWSISYPIWTRYDEIHSTRCMIMIRTVVVHRLSLQYYNWYNTWDPSRLSWAIIDSIIRIIWAIIRRYYATVKSVICARQAAQCRRHMTLLLVHQSTRHRMLASLPAFRCPSPSTVWLG